MLTANEFLQSIITEIHLANIQPTYHPCLKDFTCFFVSEMSRR